MCVLNGSFGKLDSTETLFSGSCVEVISVTEIRAASNMYSFVQNDNGNQNLYMYLRFFQLKSVYDERSSHRLLTVANLLS